MNNRMEQEQTQVTLDLQVLKSVNQ
ncbi:hypothetical protein PhageB1_073 [Staphylococcus phage B1]|nr:hypothetical protein PhageB1_073 [Staphylococcus phage B1]AVJ51987.1 hypothetical protein PhageJA1_70A [Staphylococcus phage JA1]